MDDSNGDPVSQPQGVFPSRREQDVMDTTHVDPQDILDRLDDLHVHGWTPDDESGVEHLSPVAEDFYELFELGEDAASIATGDVDGVALTAIKELASRLDEYHTLAQRSRHRIERQQEIIDSQRDDLEVLREHVESLQTKLTRLEQQVTEGE